MNDGNVSTWIVAAIAATGVLVVAVLGGWATDIGPWYRNLKKPSWQPPDWLFGPAWTVIFALVAWSATLSWITIQDGSEHYRLAVLFALNGVLNVLWSVIFFRLRRPDWAVFEVALLWLSIVALMVYIDPISSFAAALLLPYLAWVTFAAILNVTVVRMNAPFGREVSQR